MKTPKSHIASARLFTAIPRELPGRCLSGLSRPGFLAALYHRVPFVIPAFALLLLIGIFSGCGRTDARQIDAASLPRIKAAPAFALPNYDGKTVTADGLKGKVYIAYFFFTSCSGPCPVINSNANVLQAEFAELPNVRIVGFTVDPDTDTPQRLMKYARRYGAKADRWFFLRPTADEVAALASHGFMMGDPSTPALHSTRFALVDDSGMIRGYYDAMDAKAVDELRFAVRALAAEEAV